MPISLFISPHRRPRTRCRTTLTVHSTYSETHSRRLACPPPPCAKNRASSVGLLPRRALGAYNTQNCPALCQRRLVHYPHPVPSLALPISIQRSGTAPEGAQFTTVHRPSVSARLDPHNPSERFSSRLTLQISSRSLASLPIAARISPPGHALPEGLRRPRRPIGRRRHPNIDANTRLAAPSATAVPAPAADVLTDCDSKAACAPCALARRRPRRC